MDIYLTASQFGKYPGLATSTSVNNCYIHVLTEMAVFTLETDYSCETGYPFDDSRQIGNTC